MLCESHRLHDKFFDFSTSPSSLILHLQFRIWYFSRRIFPLCTSFLTKFKQLKIIRIIITSFGHASTIFSTIFYFFIESILIPMRLPIFHGYPWTCPWISREIPAHITVKRQPEITRIQTRIPTHPRLVNSRTTYTRERDLVFSDVNRFHWRYTSRSSCSWIFTSRLTPKYACLFIRQPDLHTTPMYREN